MSYLDGVLQAKRVLVTGATGFIGSRLAQRLTLEEGAVVTGTGRKMEKVPHLADAGVNLQQVDLIDGSGDHLSPGLAGSRNRGRRRNTRP
jgi:nucleoside-diphosphate-sugar epimerase